MNPHPDSGSGPVQGLFGSLRNLLATGLQVARVRLALLGTELEEQKLRLAQGLLLCIGGVLLLFLAVVLACGVVLLLVHEEHRLVALGVLTVAVGGSGAALVWAGSARLRSPGAMFQASLDELARDRAALGDAPGPQP